jgi:hypothetical protein
MSTRLKSDADIETVVRDYKYVSQEAELRQATLGWSSRDFSYAVSRLHVDLARDLRDPMLPLYRSLLAERLSEEAREQDQKRQKAMHLQLKEAVEKVSKPHWTVLPNFWLTCIGACAGIAAAWFAWLALRK